MVTTTRRMLEELRRPELFDAVLEEVTRVRAEMGYPILVTPVSQFVASQAARNVIDPERWANVSDETVRYFLGHYGEPAAPVDPDIADKVLSRPQASKLRDLQPISLDGARERFGRRISEEELLLRLTMPGEQVDAMIEAREQPGPGAGRPRPGRSPRGHAAPGTRRAGRPSPTSSSPTTAATRWCGAVLDGLLDGLLRDVRGFVFDVDGTLAHRGPDGRAQPQPGAVEVLERIRASGRPLVVFTNGSHVTSETMARGLREDGIPVADDEMLTPVESAITYIRRRYPGRPGAAVRPRRDPRADDRRRHTRGRGRGRRGRVRRPRRRRRLERHGARGPRDHPRRAAADRQLRTRATRAPTGSSSAAARWSRPGSPR